MHREAGKDARISVLVTVRNREIEVEVEARQKAADGNAAYGYSAARRKMFEK